MQEIIPRDTIQSICRKRNAVLDSYQSAYNAIARAVSALADARAMAQEVAPRKNSYNYLTRAQRDHFLGDYVLPSPEDFMATARHVTDADAWAYLIEMSDLEKLMDKTAKDQFRQQIIENPPEATEDNVFATLEGLFLQRDEIFMRGIAECFSKLDKRFKSHDGWKIGSRVILYRTFDDWGLWNYHRNHKDTLIDIERTFYILDDRDQPETYDGAAQALENVRGVGLSGPRQAETETEFFKIRTFKNGNCHVWFKRDDLVRKVNKLLAEYYGEVIPEERTDFTGDPFENVKTTPAKHYGFYPTPETAAAITLERLNTYRRKNDPLITVLEPSAGTGNLAKLAVGEGCLVDCIEMQAHLAQQLKAENLYRSVCCADFLTIQPRADCLYDRVLMNPPFDLERDIDHVMHAWKFLKPDGQLVTIMSAGTQYRETKKATAFRAFMKKHNAATFDLPARSFSEVGTNVNTIIVKINKDGRQAYW